jgi:hypothetical protein
MMAYAATREIKGNYAIRRKMYTFGVHSFTYILLFNSSTSVICSEDFYVVHAGPFKLELFVPTTHNVNSPCFLLFSSNLISQSRPEVVKVPELYDVWKC